MEARREFTLRAILLGIILSILLGAANMYVGLRVGLTVSASIPAAVLGLIVLRALGRGNMWETNVVQTTAASGQSVGAGVIFTFPALLGAFLGLWLEVEYLTVAAISITAGVMGVLFAVPLRRALIVEEGLTYPEGVACANVIKAGYGGAGAPLLLTGAVIGIAFAALQLGLGFYPETSEGYWRSGTVVWGLAAALSPILVAIGYLVGLRISILIFLGGAIAWGLLIPIMSAMNVLDVANQDPAAAAAQLWRFKARLVGAGAMLTGGILTIIRLRKSLTTAIRRTIGRGSSEAGDLPGKIVLGGLALLVIPVAITTWNATGALLPTIAATLLVYVAGFLFTAVAAYLAGVVGSSNNPISAVTILTLGATAFLLLGMQYTGAEGQLAALLVGASIAVAAAIAGDTSQDLKTGHLLGSTPSRLQIAQAIGAVAMGFVAPLVLMLLDSSFGIGSLSLPAPQAGVMTIILESIFGAGIDVPMISLGAASGLALAILKLPVLPVAVGIYLPLSLSTPIALGGILAWAAERRIRQRHGVAAADDARERGILVASGVIAGEALTGLLMAGLLLAEPEGGHVWRAAAVPTLLGIAVLLLASRFQRARMGVAAVLVGLALTGVLLWQQPDLTVLAGPIPGLLALVLAAALILHQATRRYFVRGAVASEALATAAAARPPPEAPPAAKPRKNARAGSGSGKKTGKGPKPKR